MAKRRKLDQEVLALLAKLDGCWDRIFVCPLKSAAVGSLERSLAIRFPGSFRTYPERVGIFQDLIDDDGVFATEADFKWEREFLQRVAQRDAELLFAFASDDSGNLLAMKDAGSGDDQVYRINHETGTVKRVGWTFRDYLEKRVEKSLKGYRKRPFNQQKRWHVRFTFDGKSEEPVFGVLGETFELQWNGAWSGPECIKGGASTWTRPFAIDERRLVHSRSCYPSWTHYAFSFGFDEPVLELAKGYMIERLHRAFQEAASVDTAINYTLVDYGILADDEED